MTKSGCATERHFSSTDLRRLFELMPTGVCEMLSKIQSKATSGAKGSSGKRSILEAHKKVVGVSSHDLVYNNSIVDISEGEVYRTKRMEAPFAGTPGKKNRNKCISSDVRNDVIPLGNRRKQSSGNRQKHIRPPIPINFETVADVEKLSPLILEETSNSTELSRSDQNLKKGFLDIMKDVDELSKGKEMEESLMLLFNLLKSSDLLKSEKMMVHQKIASRVSYLGWIY